MTISTPTGHEQILGRNYPILNGPIVNMNGATYTSLIEQHMAVLRAAQALLEALAQATPHGRDYQTAMPPVSSTHDRMVNEGMKADVENIRKQYERIVERLVIERNT